MAINRFSKLLEGTRVSLGSWLAHAMGVARLVQLRGPSLHRTAPAHQLFLGFRYTAVSIYSVLLYCNKDVPSKRKQIIASSAVRKATFLSEPAWKTGRHFFGMISLPNQRCILSPQDRKHNCFLASYLFLELPCDLDVVLKERC